MKKTMKILGGSLLVALMSISLATKLNVREVKHLEVRDLLTEDMTKPVTGKVVKRAANEEAANKLQSANRKDIVMDRCIKIEWNNMNEKDN